MTVFFSTTPDPSSQEEGTTYRHVASLHFHARRVPTFVRMGRNNYSTVNTTMLLGGS